MRRYPSSSHLTFPIYHSASCSSPLVCRRLSVPSRSSSTPFLLFPQPEVQSRSSMAEIFGMCPIYFAAIY
ncbi:hypothetical protein E2C01_085512 [Portunus trituberculatus]|uniref:Uncharacterized protein n=1 Tax=Portunus trituberculatus TaxID=210409 RepID=A0A5B7IYA4_PORTR|nr:hypothetical protein [Portunus trituberculatus]